MDGNKILSMSVENFHFLYSLNFIPTSLKSIHKTFDLTYKKGYDTHFFITANSLDYVGTYSEPKYYVADFMSRDERALFLTW